MTTEFQRLARRMERKYAAHIPWSQLPGRRLTGRPPVGGRARAPLAPLAPHSIKTTDDEWQILSQAVNGAGLNVSAFIRTISRPKVIQKVLRAAGL